MPKQFALSFNILSVEDRNLSYERVRARHHVQSHRRLKSDLQKETYNLNIVDHSK